MSRCALTVVTLLGWVGAAAPALALDRPAPEPDGSDPIGALLASAEQDAPASHGHLSEPLLREVLLREVLQTGFAQTPTVERTLRELRGDPIVPRDDWGSELRYHIAAARLRGRGAPSAGITYDIPLADHPLVATYIDYFTGRGRWFFERWLARSDRYIPMMRPLLVAKGLPADTVYLAMIESGFVSHAHSNAAAVGFWQFIASTGKTYRLRQDTWVDERRDFVTATLAAADFLTTLYREFGDWHLAWAGYNAGGGRIRRALASTGAGDFWSLVETPRALPKETAHYVPKIIAAAIVAKNRVQYGFSSVVLHEPLAFEEVTVDGAVALRQVAEVLGVPVDELATLNPALLYQITPPHGVWTLRVPPGRGAETRTWLAGLSPSERGDFYQHVVARGDTLWRIADRYGSSIAAIRDFNSLTGASALRIGQRLLIPGVAPARVAKQRTGRSPSAPLVPAELTRTVATRDPTRAPTPTRAAQRAIATHVVSPGETLWSISQRYKVTVESLKRWNGRQDTTIGVGETLEIF